VAQKIYQKYPVTLVSRACNYVRGVGLDIPVILTLEELEKYVG